MKNEKSDWGIVKSHKFKVNPKPNKRVWTVDDFYENPNDVRKYALEQLYWNDDHGGVGWRTRKQFIFDGVKEKIESIMDAKNKVNQSCQNSIKICQNRFRHK